MSLRDPAVHTESMVICLRGAREICNAVGENPKEIVRLVEREGLPAWRRDGRGAWRALPEDLKEWITHQRDRNLGRYQRAVYGVAAEPDMRPDLNLDSRNNKGKGSGSGNRQDRSGNRGKG